MALDEAPPFWWRKHSWQGYMLWPLSHVYGRIAAKRMNMSPATKVNVPVICVGNFVVGGAGKTPTVHMLANYAKSQGYKPGILSRGHGGAITSATVVKPEKHNAHDVGDEALLHAGIATTVISPNRGAGALLLVKEGCTLILMDDGFQNPSLQKDFRLVLVDAKRGLGNGFTMPSGPMRVPFKEQLGKADAIFVTGNGDEGDFVIRKAARAGKPVFESKTRVIGGGKFKGLDALAYAGIADPEKFYNTLAGISMKVKAKQSFGDHHVFTEEECADLINRSKQENLTLFTTEKDAARLKGMGEAQDKLLELSSIVRIELEPADPSMLRRIFKQAEQNFLARKLPDVEPEDDSKPKTTEKEAEDKQQPPKEPPQKPTA